MSEENDEQRKEDKKTAIAEAALRVFQEKGVAATRVEDICRAAGIAKGTYYLYFKTKEEVLLSLFDEVTDLGAAHGETSGDAGDTLLQIVEALLEGGRDRLDSIPVFWEVAGHRIVQEKYDLNGKIRTVFEGLTGQIRNIIDRGQRAGQLFPEADASALAAIIINSVDGIILHAALFYRDDPAYIERQKIELINMVQKYLGLPG